MVYKKNSFKSIYMMAQSLTRNLSGYALHTGSRWQCPNYWDKTVEPCHLTKQTKLLPLIKCANVLRSNPQPILTRILIYFAFNPTGRLDSIMALLVGSRHVTSKRKEKPHLNLVPIQSQAMPASDPRTLQITQFHTTLISLDSTCKLGALMLPDIHLVTT